MVFSNDGTKMFVIGWEEYVNEYALSTPFDASTRTFVDATSISSEEVDSQGIAFSNDGAKMFIIGVVGDDVNEYDLRLVYPVTVTRAPPMAAGALVTLWNVAASPHTISMPLNVHSGGTLSIDWGDNSTDTVAANGTQSHTYAVPGEYLGVHDRRPCQDTPGRYRFHGIQAGIHRPVGRHRMVLHERRVLGSLRHGIQGSRRAGSVARGLDAEHVPCRCLL